MASLLLMNFLDVARSLGSSPLTRNAGQVADFLRREAGPGGGSFNYNPSINLLGDVFRGAVGADDAEDICRTIGAPAGRKQNGDAMRIVGHYAQSHRSQCYRVPFTAVPVGRLVGDRTAYMAIKAPLVRVEGDDVFVVVPGFRMSHRPQAAEIDVAASFALAHFARGDYAIADYEYISAGPTQYGGRMLQVYHGRDRTIYDIDTVDALLDVYVRGLQIAIDGGMQATAPNFRGYRVFDPNQPGFL